MVSGKVTAQGKTAVSEPAQESFVHRNPPNLSFKRLTRKFTRRNYPKLSIALASWGHILEMCLWILWVHSISVLVTVSSCWSLLEELNDSIVMQEMDYNVICSILQEFEIVRDSEASITIFL